MNRIKPGYKVSQLSLPGIDGDFDLQQVEGKRFILSFHRFAACPFCNLHIHQLVTQYHQLPSSFEIVAIFDSPIDHLKQQARDHASPFPILADEKNTYYKQFGVERSAWGVVRGLFTRMPTLLYAMFNKGYLPLSFKGNITTMPLELLINTDGVVEHVHYGKDEGDHLSFETIHNYSKGVLP